MQNNTSHVITPANLMDFLKPASSSLLHNVHVYMACASVVVAER